MTEYRFRKAFLLLLVVAMTAALLWVLWSFVMTILMAALFTGLLRPIYLRLVPRLRGNRALASFLTILVMLVLGVVPLLGLLGIVVNQAIRVGTSVQPVVERLINEPTYLDQQLQRIPGIDRLEPYRELLLQRGGEVVGALAGFLVSSLTDTTRGAVTFVFHFFILLYTMFFLFKDGPSMLRTVLNHLPLRDDEKALMTDRFMSVTRATIKGTIVIGIIQGGLSGVSFWIIGIPDTLFWSVVMIVFSILPVLGGALVWVPAAIFLGATGHVWEALFLFVFCGVLVGSIDNVLRPRLVGRDTRMHDLVILFSTLGGIIAFGPAGFIIGPLLAGLFVTSWEMFAVAFRDDLRNGPSIVMVGAGAESDVEQDG
jgi:predicted PurR-regulated permease PerM